MNGEQTTGLILIVFGLYSVIRFRYNGKISLKGRLKIANFLSFGKVSKESTKSDIKYAQGIYLIVGILFIIIGFSKLFA